MGRQQSSTDEQRQRFGAELAQLLASRGWSQGALADALTDDGLTASQPQVSSWTLGTHEPARHYVTAIESMFGLKPGMLTRHLGYLPLDARNTATVRDAIHADPRLDDQAKRMLLALYREAIRPSLSLAVG